MSKFWECYALGLLSTMVGSGLARIVASHTDVAAKYKPNRLVAQKKRGQSAIKL